MRVASVGSLLRATSCDISGNAGAGVALLAGGSMQLEGCSVSTNRGPAGLLVSGSGTKAVVKACILSENAGTGVRVGDGGNVQLLRCRLAGNRSGWGVEVLDDAHAKAVACSLWGHYGSAAAAHAAGGASGPADSEAGGVHESLRVSGAGQEQEEGALAEPCEHAEAALDEPVLHGVLVHARGVLVHEACQASACGAGSQS